jgi:hypothetical protein
MRSKKAISAVVATVLIILITVAAVTIIWAAVIPLVKEKIESGAGCLEAVSQVSIIKEGYTCWDDDNDKVRIQISHGAKDFELADIQILIKEGGDTTTKRLVKDITAYTAEDLPGLNEEKVFEIPYTEGSAPTEVSIAPVVKVGETEEICDISASTALTACSG